MPYDGREFDRVKHLTWRRVSINSDGVIISLKVTKTIQNFERDLRIPIAESSLRPEFCVKRGLRALLRLPGYPSSKKGPVYNVYQGGQWQPMSK